MMTKKPQKTGVQQEDHHPRACRLKEEVEKEKGRGRQTAGACCVAKKGHFMAHGPNRWCVPKTQWSSWWNTLPFQKGKGKDQGDGGVKARTSSSTKVKAKVWVL